MKIVVVGAHLSGLPLNHQLTERGATLFRATRTAPVYVLFALPNTTPPKPGLLRRNERTGQGIEVEIWDIPRAEDFASFVAMIPSPLCIGTIELDDGTTAHGFLVEAYATTTATDITHLGGWRAFVNAAKTT